MEKPILAAMLSVEGKRLTAQEKYLFANHNPLGVSLFGRNIGSKAEIKDLVKEIKDIINRDNVLIAIDQEGGRVRRLIEPEFRTYVSQSAIGSLPISEAAKAVRLHTALISQDLKELGINMNYAPVLDIAYEHTTNALKSRCFSNDEKKVAQLGQIMIEEYINQGICPCIKHMMGLGRAVVDPHLNLPRIDFSIKEMRKDLYPFKAVAKITPAGMTAHDIIPEIDDNKPITQSRKAIYTLIRGIIGFKGLLISDAVEMNALSGSIGQRVKASLKAGCDVVCYCRGDAEELQEVIDNCRPMTRMGMQRLNKVIKIIEKSNFDKMSKDYNILTENTERYNDNYDATEILNKMKLK